MKLKTQREGIKSVSDLFGQYGTPGFDRNAAMSAAVLGGYEPSDLGALDRYGAANTFGATDPRTANAQVGAGDAYSSTAPAFFTNQKNENTRAANTLAESARQFNQTPQEALVNGAPSFVPREGAFATGVSPIMSDAETKGTYAQKNWANLDDLSPAQSRYIGSDAGAGGERSPKNYRAPSGNIHVTYDGVSDAQTGAPLPPGGYIATAQGSANDVGLTKAVTTDLQKDDITLDNLDAMIASAEEAVIGSPDVNFGITGVGKGIAQSATIVATNLAAGLNFKAPAEALAAFQQQAREGGVDQNIISGVFDPRLGEVQSLYGMLVYAMARVINGTGSLSNPDVQAAKDIVGDPHALMTNKQTLLSKLNVLKSYSKQRRAVTDKHLNPDAAAAPDAGVVEENWVRGPDGNLVRAP